MTRIVSTEPATGAELWSGEIGDPEAEVAYAREGWAEWADKSLAYRIEALRRFANVVRRDEAAFTDLIARETGKPLWEARTEVGAVIAKVELSITAFSERTPNRRIEGALGSRLVVKHKPHGVLAVIGPFNLPAHLPNGHIIPALLAGNAVVFKPSEKAPASGAFLINSLREAGVPRGATRVLNGGGDAGRALAAASGIDGLLFTGSAAVGETLHRSFSSTPQRLLALELGGNNPIVAWNIKDIDAAAATIVHSAFLSAGQRCTAARRLIVEDGQEGPLIEAVGRLVDRIIVDHPHAEPPPFMGPVIDDDAASRLERACSGLISGGGQPVRPLRRPRPGLPFLTPALIDVTDVRDRPDEELFGPFLQIVRVPDFDAAIAEANATRFGLAASLLGGSPQQFEAFWTRVRAGIINWNKPTNGAPSNAPFGGVGASGNHRPGAYYAADHCAYPVTSVESEIVRGSIDIGLRDPATSAN